MPANLLIPPELTFADANGKPYAGGHLYTYTPGTLVQKTSWQDSAETILNTNPIILDVRGACVVYGDGDYRLILTDADNNQIFDLLSNEPLPASAISAILPCLGQSTLQGFRDCAGITAAIQAAINNVQLLPGPTGPAGPQGIQGPTGPTGPQGPSGTSGLTAGYSNPSYFFDSSTRYQVAWGNSATGGGGTAVVNFARPFSAVQSAVVTTMDNSANYVARVVSLNNGGFSVGIEDTDNTGGKPSAFSWLAVGQG